MFRMISFLCLTVFCMYPDTICADQPSIITVVNPKAGQIWSKDKINIITWTKSGTMNTEVKIRLFDVQGQNNIKDIVDATSNDGQYDIPAGFFIDVPEGQYTVRVRTVDNQVMGNSAAFLLKNANPITGSQAADQNAPVVAGMPSQGTGQVQSNVTLGYIVFDYPDANTKEFYQNTWYTIKFHTNLSNLTVELLHKQGSNETVVSPGPVAGQLKQDGVKYWFRWLSTGSTNGEYQFRIKTNTGFEKRSTPFRLISAIPDK